MFLFVIRLCDAKGGLQHPVAQGVFQTMPFALQDQGLGGAVQSGPFGEGGQHRLLHRIERGLAGHLCAAQTGHPELVPLEVALTEVAVAAGDAVDGEVFTYLEIGRIVSRRCDGLAIQLVEHPVVVLQVLRGQAGSTAAGAEQKQGEQQ